MANPLSRKTFKIELEFTVSMDEIRAQHLAKNHSSSRLSWVKQLQRALVDHDPALIQQMVMKVLGRLQEYADYLAAQNDLSPLVKVAAVMDPESSPLDGLSQGDFADLTRPIRSASMAVQLDSSTISEKVYGAEGENEWQPVWSDLRPATELGRQLDQFCVPSNQVPHLTGPGQAGQTAHYLLVRYLTRQTDGVHVDACCSCEETLEGIGEDESKALAALWETYKKHLQQGLQIRRIEDSQKRLFHKKSDKN